MTDDQKLHAAKIGDETERRVILKYAKGVAEHGGNIWEMSPLQLLEEAINEVTDLSVYLLTLKEQLENYQATDMPSELQ